MPGGQARGWRGERRSPFQGSSPGCSGPWWPRPSPNRLCPRPPPRPSRVPTRSPGRLEGHPLKRGSTVVQPRGRHPMAWQKTGMSGSRPHPLPRRALARVRESSPGSSAPRARPPRPCRPRPPRIPPTPGTPPRLPVAPREGPGTPSTRKTSTGPGWAPPRHRLPSLPPLRPSRSRIPALVPWTSPGLQPRLPLRGNTPGSYRPSIARRPVPPGPSGPSGPRGTPRLRGGILPYHRAVARRATHPRAAHLPDIPRAPHRRDPLPDTPPGRTQGERPPRMAPPRPAPPPEAPRRPS
jgi:hypothetical protein